MSSIYLTFAYFQLHAMLLSRKMLHAKLVSPLSDHAFQLNIMQFVHADTEKMILWTICSLMKLKKDFKKKKEAGMLCEVEFWSRLF